ncbi:MAG: hypothetical protein AAFZ89_14485 [Bacteroidota bacterium]
MMQRSLIKYSTTFLFLVAFLVPRVADLHVLDHLSEDDGAVSCELCHITYISEQFDLYLGHATYDEQQPISGSITYLLYSGYNSPLAKIVSPTSVYNKPPPHISFG